MSDKRATSVSGGGVSGSVIVTLLFVVLKLTHVVDWSWWLVLCPLWIGAGIIFLVLVLIGTLLVGGEIRSRRKSS